MKKRTDTEKSERNEQKDRKDDEDEAVATLLTSEVDHDVPTYTIALQLWYLKLSLAATARSIAMGLRAVLLFQSLKEARGFLRLISVCSAIPRTYSLRPCPHCRISQS